jgi:hypothetical protein
MKLIAISLIAILALAAIATSISVADATHFWTGRKWQNPMTTSTNNAGPYCIGSSLGNTNIGFNNGVNAFGTAAGSINSLPTKWVIGPRMTWTSSCHSHIAAGSFARNDILGNVGLLIDSNNNFKIVGADITLNKNIRWTTSGCSNDDSDPFRMSYVFRHELAHWVEFFHGYSLADGRKPTYDPGSVIYPYYSCSSWNVFHSHDSSSLSAIYGNS